MNTAVRLRKICDKSSESAAMARDAPIRLSTAAELAFPDGTMTASGLRRRLRVAD
jgi:hypothetical protein